MTHWLSGVENLVALSTAKVVCPAPIMGVIIIPNATLNGWQVEGFKVALFMVKLILSVTILLGILCIYMISMQLS